MPQKFREDLAATRGLPTPTGFDTTTLPPHGVVAFVDEAVHHATPMLKHRTVPLADFKKFVTQDDEFKDRYAAAEKAWDAAIPPVSSARSSGSSPFAHRFKATSRPEEAVSEEMMDLLHESGRTEVDRQDLLDSNLTNEHASRLLQCYGPKSHGSREHPLPCAGRRKDRSDTDDGSRRAHAPVASRTSDEPAGSGQEAAEGSRRQACLLPHLGARCPEPGAGRHALDGGGERSAGAGDGRTADSRDRRSGLTAAQWRDVHDGEDHAGVSVQQRLADLVPHLDAARARRPHLADDADALALLAILRDEYPAPGAPSAPGADPVADLVSAFGLTDLDADLLTVAAATDLDLRFGAVFARLLGSERWWPTVGLALELCSGGSLTYDVRSRVDAAAPLRRLGLVRTEEGGPVLLRAFHVEPRVLAHLLGDDRPDPDVADLMVAVPARQDQAADRVARAFASGARLAHVRSRPGTAGLATARGALERAGLDALVVDLSASATARARASAAGSGSPFGRQD